jgi:Arylsulfotransferase (ASST)
MFLSSWYGHKPSCFPVTSRRRAGRGRLNKCLCFESLEERTLLSYSFTLIADNGPHSFFSAVYNAPMTDQGILPFHANLRSGGEGIFTRAMDGSLGIIAITSDLLRTIPFSLSINGGGTVGFGADLRDGVRAIFTGNGQELTRVVDTGPDSPLSDLLPPAATINDAGMVAFRGTLKSGGSGLFTVLPGEQPRTLYVTGGSFAAFLSSPTVEKNGETVSFLATLSSGEEAIFTGNGGATTAIATTGELFSAFSDASSINDAGTVAFLATLTAGGQAVLTGNGGPLTVVADTTGPFSGFIGNVAAINNAGVVAFAATLKDGSSGVFTGPDPAADKIIATGDPLFGSTVVSIDATPFPPRGLNNAGQLTFLAQLADGRTVLVRADLVSELNPCTISLVPSKASPPPVGEQITWTATATNCGQTPVYQFSVGPVGGPLHLVRDFSPANSFAWTAMQEGGYYVLVTVKDGFGATARHFAVVIDQVTSRISGAQAVITPTANPLVALYSVPPGPAGTVHVDFSVAGGQPSWRSTNELPSVPGESTNFLVAGMLPNTSYQIQYVRSDGTTSSPLVFTTGSLPSTLVFPTFTVRQPPGSGSDVDQDMLFHQLTSSPNNVPNPLATDLTGRIVWYYDVSQSGFTRTYPGQSLVPGGTVLVLGVDHYAPLPGTLDVLREIDLAGNVVRETNIDAVNPQLAGLGYHPLFSFTHDVQRLPDGRTAVIGSTERTISINGIPTDYVGMTIVVLDENFQVAWAWDAFDHLDVNRGPILGEIMHPGDGDQVAASTPKLPAVDWLHINAVSWSPTDRNLVLSMRHQDWVVKIDYRNGAGDGHVVWRLGKDGDFSTSSTVPSPWFSHQHHAHYIDESTLILFDNGNTRRAGDPNADSRGQVWTLDEQTMMATLVFNVDLGNYSDALGAAQRLSNGNYSFTSGRPEPNFFGQSIEVHPDGTKAYVLEINRALYRSLRGRTLYEGTNDLRGGGGSASPRTPFHRTGHRGSSVAVESANYDAANLVVRIKAPVLSPGSPAAAAQPQPDQASSSSEFSMPVRNTNKRSTEMQEPRAGFVSIFRSMGDKSTAARDFLFAEESGNLTGAVPELPAF